ncbi:hypothetical protein FJZ27_01100 [Candidatus Peribacteria bacterium]|nr:hypothetical protein [Candidatus Peribacteria bacterium]
MEAKKDRIQQARETYADNPLTAAELAVFEAFSSLPEDQWQPEEIPTYYAGKKKGTFKVLNTELDLGGGKVVTFKNVVVDGYGTWWRAGNGGTIEVKKENDTLKIQQDDGIYFSFNGVPLDYHSGTENSATLTQKIFDVVEGVKAVGEKMKQDIEDQRNGEVDARRREMAEKLEGLADF